VKRAVPNLKVGTADSWNKYADGTADPVIRVSDILYVGLS
jgi:glucan 1,3-beta-glucosidase